MSEFPTKSHKLLDPFAGCFKAEVKFWMGPGDPHISTGVMTNSWELNNTFLHQVYEGDPSDPTFAVFRGRGYWGYNPTTSLFEGFWIDTGSTSMTHETGTFDETEKTWTMTGAFTDPHSGEAMSKKSNIALIDDNSHQMKQWINMPDGSEIHIMEINYVRKT